MPQARAIGTQVLLIDLSCGMLLWRIDSNASTSDLNLLGL